MSTRWVNKSIECNNIIGVAYLGTTNIFVLHEKMYFKYFFTILNVLCTLINFSMYLLCVRNNFYLTKYLSFFSMYTFKKLFYLRLVKLATTGDCKTKSLGT